MGGSGSSAVLLKQLHPLGLERPLQLLIRLVAAREIGVADEEIPDFALRPLEPLLAKPQGLTVLGHDPLGIFRHA